MKKKWIVISIGIFIALLAALFVVRVYVIEVKAAGLVDETINSSNLYSKYPLKNYQLDFYVDNSWAWLPWNWKDGIGKSVMYALYSLTDVIWTLSLYISNGTGYVVQEAYKLDFIKDMANSIGMNIQTLAGVSKKGFSPDGLYLKLLLLIVLIVGVYAAYTGMIKREVSKAVHAVVNLVVVFVFSSAVIAYAPDYIKMVNNFSSELSTTVLDVGTKMVMPDSDIKGADSVDLIRDCLFSVQVEQPWLLLQYGTTDKESIGSERIEKLVSISPSTNSGEDREAVVKEEIEENDNANLTVAEVGNRLGMTIFLFFFNIGISIFVFLLTGLMLLSQILFIIFALFLPVSFLLSMIPLQEGKWKKAVTLLFNTIMMRVGITLIITVAFSISSMLYSFTNGYPFFMIAFLQIVVFAGVFLNLEKIMGMFSFDENNTKSGGKRFSRMFYYHMRRQMVRANNKLGRKMYRKNAKTQMERTGNQEANEAHEHVKKGRRFEDAGSQRRTDVRNMPNVERRVTDNIKQNKEKRFDMPTYEGNPAIKEMRMQKSNLKNDVSLENGKPLVNDGANQISQQGLEKRRELLMKKRKADSLEKQKSNGQSLERHDMNVPRTLERNKIRREVPLDGEKNRPMHVAHTIPSVKSLKRPIKETNEGSGEVSNGQSLERHDMNVPRTLERNKIRREVTLDGKRNQSIHVAHTIPSVRSLKRPIKETNKGSGEIEKR